MAITVVDNRETCTSPVPSACVPYTGYISDTLKDIIPCKPNINDILAQLQDFVDKINISLGDNKTIVTSCLPSTLDITTATQKDINQNIIDLLCALKATVEGTGSSIDSNNIPITIDLSCLEDPSCDPKVSYKLIEVLNKLVTNYCDLNTRTTKIEQLLNL